jgi:putative spermidine/putrescine transport system substrate-binding protein
MKTGTTRRQFLELVACGSAGGLLAAKTAHPAAAGAAANIVAPSFAGVWVDGLKASVVPCYKAKTGGEVEIVVGTPTDFVQKVMATRDRPALDVMIGPDSEVFYGMQLGIIEKLNPAKIPNLEGILPIFKDPYEGYAFGFDGGRDGLTCNTNRIKNPPKSWVEFTERVAKGEFGRAVMYPHLTSTDGLAITWIVNRELGGSLTDLSPFLKRMKAMKPYIVKFWTSTAEPGTALIRGEVDIAAWTDGRTFGVQAAGHKHLEFFLPAPGSPALTICFMKVKNGSDYAWDYLNCAADAKNQALWNQFFPGYYMTHRDIVYPPASREKQDPTALDKTFRNWLATPWKDLARVRPQWMEAWTKEIGA